jgi:lysylphosphatidylglycerol synthetase-like protein (DUF2156 family)
MMVDFILDHLAKGVDQMKSGHYGKALLVYALCMVVAVLFCFMGLSNDFNYYVLVLLCMFVSLISLFVSAEEQMDRERSYMKRICYLLAVVFCCVAMLFFLLYFPLSDASYGVAQELLGNEVVNGDKAISFASIIFATSALLISGVQAKSSFGSDAEDAARRDVVASKMRADAFDDDGR